MRASDFTSYGMKRRPDQHIHNLKEMAREQERSQHTSYNYNQDRTQVIVYGVQPDNTFGIVIYKVDGDQLTEIKRVA